MRLWYAVQGDLPAKILVANPCRTPLAPGGAVLCYSHTFRNSHTFCHSHTFRHRISGDGCGGLRRPCAVQARLLWQRVLYSRHTSGPCIGAWQTCRCGFFYCKVGVPVVVGLVFQVHGPVKIVNQVVVSAVLTAFGKPFDQNINALWAACAVLSFGVRPSDQTCVRITGSAPRSSCHSKNYVPTPYSSATL